jgi:peroxiredoxin
MRVEVLYTADCPGYERALVRLQEALRDAEVGAEITMRRVRTPEDAEALSFPGSPTIRIDGRDIETAPPEAAGLCCRAYRQSDGSLAPIPPRETIEAALHAALGRSPGSAAESVVTPLTLAAAAPEFVLPATDGRTYTLASFAGSQCLAIVFLANHCPYASAWEGRVVALARRYGRRGVAFAAICSSDATRFPADAPERMAERARDRRFPFPYLYDEDQTVARAFGATHTPHLFLFDGERRLRYQGAIDSDWEDGDAAIPYVRDALDALLSGVDVPRPITDPRGSRLRYRAHVKANEFTMMRNVPAVPE